jgi:2'-5' RNA ligase
MRLFVALDLPQEIKDKLFLLKDVNLNGAHWTSSEQWHLTLHFIGETEDDTAIQAALSTTSARSFSLKLEGIGTFPPKGQPRVLWVGINSPESLKKLYQQVGEALKLTGFQAESRPYHPHITLARFKQNVPSSAAMDGYQDKHNKFITNSFIVDHFSLYESKLERTGAIYRVRAQYDFR